MFRGRYEHKVDSKGRTSFPAKFREVLEARGEHRLIVTSGLEKCLVAYPLSEWEAFETRLAALPQFDPSVAMLRRIYVSGAVECDLDKVGRISIPVALRKHAKLTKEVLWAGMGSHIELWSEELFHALTKHALKSEDDKLNMAERLAELGL